jgi:hypothetical protein
MGTVSQGDLVVPSLEGDLDPFSDPAGPGKVHLQGGPREQRLHTQPEDQGESPPGQQNTFVPEHSSLFPVPRSKPEIGE